MDSHRSEADRMQTDVQHLRKLLSGDLEGDRLELALSVATRVRRTATILTRRLAKERDATDTAKEADTE